METRHCWRCREEFKTNRGMLYCKTCDALPDTGKGGGVITRALVDPYRGGKVLKGQKVARQRDVLQPYHKDGSVNQTFLEEYGTKPFKPEERARIEEKFGK